MRRPMRIGIDARKLHDFGIGTYLQNLLKELVRLDDDAEYVVLCYRRDLEWLATLGPRVRPVLTAADTYSLLEQIEIPWRLWRAGVDLFHSPHYVLPLLVTCPSVVTIHDCIHLMFPQYLPNKLAIHYARFFMWWATRRARLVMTVSEASKRDILHFFNVPPEKVVVVHNAIDERFLTPPPDIELQRVRERYQLQHGFVLYAGNIKPHKNLVRLIEAFSQVRQGPFQELKLLIIGDEISKLPALRRAVHQLKLHKHVRFLGYIPDETLAVLYRSAEVFVFPSLYEGFGLPPLEAMASGTPVVTSNTSSMPEVTGGAAVLVDPYDVGSIVDGVRRVLTDPSLAAELRRKGPLRAREFSWARSVAKTKEIYESVAAGRS